jgi:pimeloyl-ACP methyl ester carboxylesterase
MSHRIRQATIRTSRGPFAALCADPAGGVGDRQAALLVPGYTGSKEDFLSVLESLAAAGRAVTAVDLRGQYESDPAADRLGYGLDQLGQDVVALATAIADDSGKVHVLGHSFGGLVARQAALAAPGSFLSLTLLCSGPATIGGARATALRDLLDYLEPAGDDVDQLGDMIARLWDSQMRPQAEADGAPPEIIEFLRKRALRSCPLGLAEMAVHLLNCPDHTAGLARAATFPILVSYGENDDAWPPDVQDLMARRLAAERICIPGAAHSPAVEAPETTAAMLTNFWNHAESARLSSRRQSLQARTVQQHIHDARRMLGRALLEAKHRRRARYRS